MAGCKNSPLIVKAVDKISDDDKIVHYDQLTWRMKENFIQIISEGNEKGESIDAVGEEICFDVIKYTEYYRLM